MELLNRAVEAIYNLGDEPSDWWQWGLVAGSVLVSLVVGKAIHLFFNLTETKFEKFCRSAFENFSGLRKFPIILSVVLAAFYFLRNSQGLPAQYIETVLNLVLIYCVYNILTVFSKGLFIPRLVGVVMYLMLGLSVFGWLKPVQDSLSEISVPLGDINLNVWAIVSGLLVLLILLWLVGVITSLVDTGTRKSKSIPPTVKVLIGKASRLILYVSAVLISLKTAGVNLGALAFFSGALGLGIGFGLQKVISNLVSGVIILLDKSIKPGDVIEIDGTYGWINTLRTRYVSVLTRDRKEILIPNEDFVTNKVVNWSFSDTNVRIKADVGIAYDADVEKAIGCCVQAAKRVKRVLADPAPRCLMMGFGDSSIDLQIRFWINDANEGVANVRSAVLLEVWKSFKELGIEIPFPQREVLIKNPPAAVTDVDD